MGGKRKESKRKKEYLERCRGEGRERGVAKVEEENIGEGKRKEEREKRRKKRGKDGG